MPTKLLGIAPYAGLRELMLDVASRRSDIELEVYVGDLADGLELALQHQRRGFAGIVSRGGTAEMIKRADAIGVPVTEVEVSVYDVLRAIKLAQSYRGKFAIVGFPGITNCAKILCDLLQYEIEIVTIKSQDEVASCLENLKKQGFSMMLGDMVTTVNAKLANMNGILITSGGESVDAAFDRAAEMSGGSRKNLEEIDFLHALLLSTKDEVVVFNKKGDIKLSTARSLEEDIASLMRKNIASVLERGERKIWKQQDDENLYTILGKSFSTATEQYCAFTLKQAVPHRVYDGQGVTFQNTADLMEDVNNIFCRSNSINKFAVLVEKYARSDFPVLITGETGTGKDKTANSIYVRGKRNGNPMVSIDCAVVGEKKWAYLLKSEYSPFLEENLTIYVKNLAQLSEGIGTQLVNYFEDNGVCGRNRLIFSYAARRDDDEPSFCRDLKNRLSCLLVKLLPLRQRPEDIPSLCSLYINDINAETGKGVIGLTPEAMALMREFHWKHNLNQLQRVLTQLVILSDSPYISANTVADVLVAEGGQEPEPVGAAKYNFNLNQSLNDINKDIAKAVLREEGMSRSQTANRLQISRSTLWRMLSNE